jgi:hypothetical protein
VSGVPWQVFLWTEDIPPRIFIKTRMLFTTKAVYRVTLLYNWVDEFTGHSKLEDSDKQVAQWKSRQMRLKARWLQWSDYSDW